MVIFDRLNIGVIAVGVGLCGAAVVALSPDAAADPSAAGGCSQGKEVCAPLADMAGVPMALPGPVPAAPAVPVVPALPAAPAAPLGVPAPLAPPVPVIPAVPAGAPVAAGAPVPAASLFGMSGNGGKGEPTGPAPVGAPVPGQPLPAGPQG
jgi:predicted component of type VI protein secretion system